MVDKKRFIVTEIDNIVITQADNDLAWEKPIRVHCQKRRMVKGAKMISDDTARKLHDRFSRGDLLSAEERKQLQDWYATQDAVESRLLGLTPSEKIVASLQTQVDAALAQLTTVTKRIQEIASENETLRREISALRHQLMQRLGAQPA